MNAKQIFYFTLLATGFCLTEVTQGEPILLASFDHTSAGAVVPTDSELRVRVILFHERNDFPIERLELGANTYWEDGQTGLVDFDSINEPDFADFAVRLTDGLNELLGITVLSADGGGGSGGPESLWSFGSPDLAGNNLDFIRLIVHQTTVEPYFEEPFGDGIRWQVDMTYEFWGQVIPEPATLALLGLGCFMLRRGQENSPETFDSC